jgi:acetyl esterase/lipase
MTQAMRNPSGPARRQTRLQHITVALSVAVLSLAGSVLADPTPAPERVTLWNGSPPVGAGTSVTANAFLTIHRPVEPNGAAIVICPGGGYGKVVVGPEGHAVAQWLTRHGFVGIVLEYRLPCGNPQVPLQDARRAIRLARAKARDWNFAPNRIGIMGFSAGGHLAAMTATQMDPATPRSDDPIDRFASRPDFTLLIYPVITMGAKTHEETRNNLLGPNPDAETIERFSNEKQVTRQTPPVFLAFARDDSVVSPDNSRMFQEALQAHGVPVRCLELPSGNHGLNRYKGPMWEAWQAQSLQWMTEQGILPRSASITPVSPAPPPSAP